MYDDLIFDPLGNYLQRIPSTGPTSEGDGYITYQQDTAIYEAYSNLIGDIDYAGNSVTPDSLGYGAKYGCYTDPETNLVLMGQRYYDPESGHFLTRDPTGYNQGVNLYGYCEGNPVNRRDPEGTGGVIVGFTAGADGGVPYLGAGATASISGTYLWDEARHLNYGDILSFGGFAGMPVKGANINLVKKAESLPWAIGQAAGVGGTVTYTNAHTNEDLSGPFNHYHINFPKGVVYLELGRNKKGQLIWIVGGELTAGGGWSFGMYTTITKVLSGQ